MKKVLALVLALTMVLGFAATASASWNIKYDLLTNANTFDNLTVGGDSYDPDMAVDGNKEYTFKLVLTDGELNPSFVTYDASYDAYNELNFYINSLGWS